VAEFKMYDRLKIKVTTWIYSLACFALVSASPSSVNAITWNRAQRQEAEWFKSDEGRQVVENVLLYQFPSGGWPKNTDMAQPLSEAAKKRLAERRRDESTIDNGGTHTQLRFLARAHAATNDERVREAFLKGLDWLLTAQYDSGGWPMFHPPREGYYTYIDFNDNAQSGVMMLMDDVAHGQSPFDFVDADRRKRAAAAFTKGIDCILKCQVVVDGRRTAWCAQHDEKTYAPAPARTFEPVSLSGHESVGLVRCLMRVENPSPEIVAAVQSAVKWLKDVKIEGIRVVRTDTPEGRDRAVEEDSDAPPIWARFYEIGTNRPIFTGRDSIVRYNYGEIERERRLGYAYYGDWPKDLIEEDYPTWAKKWGN
jgi:PelA/Pel-15E family pectate lyase